MRFVSGSHYMSKILLCYVYRCRSLMNLFAGSTHFFTGKFFHTIHVYDSGIHIDTCVPQQIGSSKESGKPSTNRFGVGTLRMINHFSNRNLVSLSMGTRSGTETSKRVEGVGWFYSTPNESLRLTLYSTTLPSFTIAFCATTSTPRMFLTVFDDLLTASLMASSNPLLDVPTSSIIFPTGILSLLFSLPADYFTLSDETRHSQRSLAQGPSREKKGSDGA